MTFQVTIIFGLRFVRFLTTILNVGLFLLSEIDGLLAVILNCNFRLHTCKKALRKTKRALYSRLYCHVNILIILDGMSKVTTQLHQ